MTLAARLLVLGGTLALLVTITWASTRGGLAAPGLALDAVRGAIGAARDATAPEPEAETTTATAAATAATAAAGCPQPCAPYQIVWAGDILLGDRAQWHLDQNGYTWPFAYVRHLLVGDFTIGNAEGPITTRVAQHFDGQEWHYNAQPPAAQALAEVGFSALSLANNHALDRGPEGLADTLRHTREAGIRTFGAGLDDEQAAAPLLVETPYGVVGVVGLGKEWDYGAVAGPGKAGTIPYTDEQIDRLKQRATGAGARWVVAFVHWGDNYEGVTSSQRRVAASFARAGYDLVVGSHPHVAQGVEIVDGMPVVYSLGNFVFGSPGRYTSRVPGYSMVARTLLGPEGFQSIELDCIFTDNEIVDYQPRPCTDDESRRLMRRLGAPVMLRDDRGVVELRPRRE